MARNDKLSPGIQVFRGSRPRQDVFAANHGTGCCSGTSIDFDKLAQRTRFDNALAHSNPTGANDKFSFPYGDGFADTAENVIKLINDEGVGAHISVLAIPTYAFVTGVGIHIEAEEPGLTFDLVTRNGLVIPGTRSAGATLPVTDGQNGETVTLPAKGSVNVVTAEVTAGCDILRTATPGSSASFAGFGALGNNTFIDIFGRDGDGEFSLEADEIALRVATMPASGKVTGDFKITVSVSYDVIHRAEN